MAACAKCGATLPSDGVSFCPACGAAVGTAAPALPPMPGYVVAPPPGSGNSVLKVVLIVVAVVFGLGALGAGVAGFIGYRALHNAGASFSASSNAPVSVEDLGIELYPGAASASKGTVRMKIAGNSMVTSVFTTNDSPEDVVKFYQDKMGPSAEVDSSAQGTTLQRGKGPGEDGDSLLITVTRNKSDGKTNIVIVHSQVKHTS